MQIVFIRHSMTAGNLERRYIGCRTDEPLCEAGISLAQQKTAEIRQTFPMPEVVLTSPMRRCVQTAEILFPDTPREIVYGLQECDFGDFEGKNYAELSGDPAYQAWIDSGGQMMVPNGESGAGFRHRCCRAYEQCVRDAQEKGAQRIAIVCHGGTIMSVLERYGRPEKSFYEWQVANGCGILTETIEEGGYHYGIREIGKWE